MAAPQSPGCVLARILAGSWRSLPPELDLSPAQIAAISPALIASGAAAMAWWRVCHSGIRLKSGLNKQLREKYLQSAIAVARHEIELVRVSTLLRSAGIEAILIKGWAAARLYPEAGLRPAGDIDLCVPPAQHSQARSLLAESKNSPFVTDLDHNEITKFEERTFFELLERSRSVPLNGTQIRIPGAEDHLRILCIHLLKHGAWRPLWLCDVAAALESLPINFDWDRCLGKNKQRAQWVVCTLGLARRLLDAEIKESTIRERTDNLPRWLVDAVLKQWNHPFPPNLPLARTQIKQRLTNPVELFREFKKRWRNPIQATVDAHGSFNNMPRLPFQVRDCVFRTMKFLPQLPRSLRE